MNLAIGTDLRDMRALMSAAAQGEPVDWAAVLAIYEDGKNQAAAGARPLARLACPSDYPHAFPNGAAVYGRETSSTRSSATA